MSDTPTDLVKKLYQRWGAAFAKHPGMPLDEWRAMIAEWPEVTAEPGGVDYVEVDANGVPAMSAIPKVSAEDRGILHGGGFVTGSMYTHRKMSPEHTHPAPVEDALSAFRCPLDQGIEPSPIAFTSDSAGGGLVVTTMLLARHHGHHVGRVLTKLGLRNRAEAAALATREKIRP